MKRTTQPDKLRIGGIGQVRPGSPCMRDNLLKGPTADFAQQLLRQSRQLAVSRLVRLF